MQTLDVQHIKTEIISVTHRRGRFLSPAAGCVVAVVVGRLLFLHARLSWAGLEPWRAFFSLPRIVIILSGNLLSFLG